MFKIIFFLFLCFLPLDPDQKIHWIRIRIHNPGFKKNEFFVYIVSPFEIFSLINTEMKFTWRLQLRNTAQPIRDSVAEKEP
jgi:hypothetical protein